MDKNRPYVHRRSSSLPLAKPVEPLTIRKLASVSEQNTPRSQPPSRHQTWRPQSNQTISPQRSVAPQFDPSSPELEDSLQQFHHKCHCLHELYETEVNFVKDMACIIYFYRNSVSDQLEFSQRTLAVLFGNVAQVHDMSRLLLELLKRDVDPEILRGELPSTSPNGIFVGRALLEFFNSDMYEIYEEYIRNNRNQMLLYFKLSMESGTLVQQWLKESTANAQCYTTAWALDALLIKPVQRLGKYLLFMKTLIKTTSPQHPDHENLVRAYNRIRCFVECIDRRIDMA